MPEVFHRVNGRKLTKLIAALPEVQRSVDKHTIDIGAEAEGILLAHRHEGHARIVVEKGKVDGYVILEDEAALSIEYGRQYHRDENGRWVGGMEAIAPLRRAAFGKRG